MRYLSFILITIVLVAGGVAYLRPEHISQLVAPPLVVTKTTTIPSAPSTATTSINHYHYETVGVSYDYLERRLAELMVERTIIIDRRSESGSRRGGSSGGSATVDDVTPDQLAAADFGDFTCNGTTCDLDIESYGLEDLSDVGAMTETFGDVLMWNGTMWTNVATSSLGIGAGSGSPGGANTQVQFNNGGVFAGDAGFTYDAAADRVTATYASTTGISASYASSTNAFFGALTLGGDTLTDFTGAGLSVSSGALTISTAGDWTGLFDGQEGSYYLANSFSSTSATHFVHSSTTIPKTYTANTFTSAQVFSGGVTIGTLNGPLQANNGVISATTSVGVLYGGTGLTTAPTYGQVLVGNASGGYTLTATSSLGLGGSSGLTSYDAWTHPAAGQSATTSLMLFNGNASSTQFSAMQAYFGGTATTTFTAAGFLGVGSSSPWAQLSINPTSANGSAPAFAIGSSTATSFVITNAGNVGIGSTSPAARLGVAGNIYTTGDLVLGGGTGKLTVGTVDPVYTVDGVNYATYVSGMVGIKEEVTGAADIHTPVTADDGSSGYVAVLDFDDELPGSDLWLFAQATHIRKHIDRLIVLLSAENGARVWYEIDEAERKVYLLSDTPTRVSYRMTAPRFDTAEWTNYNLDGITGFKPPSNDIGDYFSELFTLSFGSTTAYLSDGLTEALRTWFADATNGIGSMMANVFSAKEKICVDGECLTKDDIRVLLRLVGEERGGAGGGEPPVEPEDPPVEEGLTPTPETPLPEEEPEPEPKVPEEPPSTPEEPAGETPPGP